MFSQSLISRRGPLISMSDFQMSVKEGPKAVSSVESTAAGSVSPVVLLGYHWVQIGPYLQKCICSSHESGFIEEYLEEKNGKQYKFFDGKKVWLSAFWCVILSLTLALAKFIEWRELPFYLFVILGASTFLYEAFLKKIGIKKDA